MNSKTATLLVLLFVVSLAIYLDARFGEETIKPSTKKKALKSQGILLGALAILGIF